MAFGSTHKATKLLKLQVYHVHVMQESQLHYCCQFKDGIHNSIQLLDTSFLDEARFS